MHAIVTLCRLAEHGFIIYSACNQSHRMTNLARGCMLQSIETNTRVYIVMEEATGGDLLNVIRKQKRLSERQAGFWLRQLSDGVEYCHQRGVVHRDLKCENLLLDAKASSDRQCSLRSGCLVALSPVRSQSTHKANYTSTLEA